MAMGAGLTLPIASRMSRLAAAAPGDRPCRLLTFFVPHGVPYEYVEPLGKGPDFLGQSSVFAPFAAAGIQERTTVIRGLNIDSMAETHEALPAVLRGESDPSVNVDSIDTAIAAGLGTKPHVLGVVPWNEQHGFGNDTFLSHDGDWVVPTAAPTTAADRLFENLGTPAPGDDDGGMVGDEATFRNAAMELTERQLENLQTQVQGLSAEEDKLNKHLDAVRELKATGDGGSIPISCDSRPDLPLVEATAGLNELDINNLTAMLHGHLEAAAAAMICNTAPVITIQNLWTNAQVLMNYPGGPGVALPYHDPISHSQNSTQREEFGRVQRWFYQALADHLLDRLLIPDPADTDPANTVLDNSIVHICSEVGDGFEHNKETRQVWVTDIGMGHQGYLPSLLIGGGGGVLQTGRVVDITRFNTDMFATLAHVMAVPMDEFNGRNVSVIEELLA